MPTGKVQEAVLYPIPEGVGCPAVLTSVEAETIPYVVKSGPNAGKKSSFSKWTWTFTIQEGPHAGTVIEGNTEPQVTDATDRAGKLHLARPWYEAILGRPLTLEEDIDTDVLIGYPCVVVVGHEDPRPKKNSQGIPDEREGYWYNISVADVLPPGTTVVIDEPPF